MVSFNISFPCEMLHRRSAAFLFLAHVTWLQGEADTALFVLGFGDRQEVKPPSPPQISPPLPLVHIKKISDLFLR